MDFGQIWEFWVQFWPNKWVSPTFRPDHQVNPGNRPSKDSKTAAVSEFAIIGQSPPLFPPSSTGINPVAGTACNTLEKDLLNT